MGGINAIMEAPTKMIERRTYDTWAKLNVHMLIRIRLLGSQGITQSHIRDYIIICVTIATRGAFSNVQNSGEYKSRSHCVNHHSGYS